MSLVVENKLSYLILFGDVFIKMYTETPKLLYIRRVSRGGGAQGAWPPPLEIEKQKKKIKKKKIKKKGHQSKF